MNSMTIILSLLITALAFYFLYKKPVNILSLYLFAVPVLPPVPIGSIEISILDLLAIPTVIALIYALPRNGFRINEHFNIGLFLYLTAAVISVISFSLQAGLFSMAIFMRLIRLTEIFLPVLLASLMIPRMKKENILVPFLYGGAIASAIAIIFFLTGYSLKISQQFAAEGIQYFRAAGTHADSGSFGMLAALTSLVSIWVLIYLKTGQRFLRGKLSLLALIAGLLSIGALVLSLSRGGVLFLILGLIILLLPLFRHPLRLIKIIMITLILIMAGSIMVNSIVDNNLIALSLDAFWDRITGLSEISEDFARVSSNRTYYWEKTWELYKSTPSAWPFGLGYKSIPLHYHLLADNNFNQALFEMGIAGAISLITMIILGFIACFRAVYSNLETGIILPAVWIGFISIMITADALTYWHNISALFILMTFFYQLSIRRK